jgi:hypothetical protein
MTLHPSTFEYLKPTDEQIAAMATLREAARAYAEILDANLPDGPDKTYVLRAHRSNAMWVNVCVTRYDDGTPRDSEATRAAGNPPGRQTSPEVAALAGKYLEMTAFDFGLKVSALSSDHSKAVLRDVKKLAASALGQMNE